MGERYIGLMSGTSMDGIDAALVDFAYDPPLIAHHHHPIPEPLHQRLERCIQQPERTGLDELMQLDGQFGQALAEAALELLRTSATPAEAIHAIGSHGQTLRHQPLGPNPFSLQIGDPNIIAARTGITTVADFRRRDLALGGQGAPLVPGFHAAHFTHPKQHRVIVNIGGIANITLLHAQQGLRGGFDTGPGNTLLDYWIQAQRQCAYDAEGHWAASGALHEGLLQTLLAEPYFQQPPPKSSGRELFNGAWLEQALTAFAELPAADVQATLAELTAVCIAQAIEQHAPETEALFVCGGGSHNRHLLQRLSARLPRRAIKTTAALGMDPDWVEAMAFAWLAQTTLRGEDNNAPQVTGARHGCPLGAIYPGRDFRTKKPRP